MPETASPGARAQLTERERQCLRLVARGFTTKEIAGELGIANNTVNVRCESATRKLGANGRRQAARLLSEAEATTQTAPTAARPSDSLGSEQIRLSDPLQIDAFPTPYDAEFKATGGAIEMRDAVYRHPQPRLAYQFRLPLRRKGERHNELTPFVSLLWAPLVMLLFVLAIRLTLGTLNLLSDNSRASGSAVAILMRHFH